MPHPGSRRKPDKRHLTSHSPATRSFCGELDRVCRALSTRIATGDDKFGNVVQTVITEKGVMRVNRDLGVGVVLGMLLALFLAGGPRELASARQQAPEPAASSDNAELAKMYDEDQGDRAPSATGRPIDWKVVGPRDRQREARVKSLYESGALRTGKDYYRCAMVLQHASKPEDYLLAHEFCVVALAKGEKAARWLAAATEDRYLMNRKLPQRFGTQYFSAGPNQPTRLHEIAPGVTDALRHELGVPTLAEARRRETEMNEPVKKDPAPKPGP
jgi:hypothetical protein